MGEGVAWAWLEEIVSGVEPSGNGRSRGRLLRNVIAGDGGLLKKTLPGNHGKCDG